MTSLLPRPARAAEVHDAVSLTQLGTFVSEL
jgi:hypothetical protein